MIDCGSPVHLESRSSRGWVCFGHFSEVTAADASDIIEAPHRQVRQVIAEKRGRSSK
jgi:hypothetical protein